MKSLKNILIYALPALMLCGTSCDFLDKEPENKVPEKNVDFTKTENMYQPVSGVYAKLRTGGMHWVIWPLSVVRDDDIWSGRIDDQATLVAMGEYNYDNTFWGLNEMWNQYYRIIKVANAALVSLDSYAEHITQEEDKARYRSYCGEVRFLRAYAYFRLVQAFGAVTILRDNAQTDMTRSTINAVYRYALEDLKYTEEHTPKLRPNEMAHFGAVTAFSAQHLAAKIHLNMGRYEEVEKLTDNIINSKKFELYPDFYQLFKIPGKVCDESLLECQCTDFGKGSGDIIGPGEWFSFQGPANNGNISGWGFIGIYKEFRHWARQRGEKVRATTSFLEAGTTTPSGDVIRPLQNPTQTDCWNGKAYTPLNQLTEGRTKYGSNNNVRILRYADVLLMNAEAKVRLGKNGDAPLNLVRARAEMPAINGATIEQILDERRMELVCEWGERYNDLIRTGKASSVLGAKGWTADKTYYPIPYEQLSNVPSLKNEPKDE
ncbi:RagB/SusD family nutrient uptake outer membrane protein [Bacteroides pyogenes]|uniref:RagB/SusD family nutrient uptake outer membrane protein n=1 Tax=Bacteroides pyogenes TaxID=310300 RepID=UPI003B43BAF3